jgi:Holliday junction resolvasome RuvABC endonuclease subunit
MSGRIFAIDPGPETSGWVLYDAAERRVVLHSASERNADLVGILRRQPLGGLGRTGPDVVAIEQIALRPGQPAYREIVPTLLWTGRFVEAWSARGGRVELVTREAVKRAVLGSPRGDDAQVRAALLDLHGGAGACGTKRVPGPLYGIKTHAWAALAVAVTVAGIQPAPLRLEEVVA